MTFGRMELSVFFHVSVNAAFSLFLRIVAAAPQMELDGKLKEFVASVLCNLWPLLQPRSLIQFPSEQVEVLAFAVVYTQDLS